MKTLPEELTSGGFLLKQIQREGDVAIYEQTKKGSSWKRYEVVIPKKNKAAEFKLKNKEGEEITRTVEEGESYPSSEDWGSKAWTCVTLEEAQAKLQEVSK